ncbi:MAG: hypothetical protein VW200_03760 [Pelagibacteraceae bacterium]
MAKGKFYWEGKLFNYEETTKPVKVEYIKFIYGIKIDGEDKEYVKKNYKKLKEVVELYYLDGKN